MKNEERRMRVNLFPYCVFINMKKTNSHSLNIIYHLPFGTITNEKALLP